MDRLHPGVYIQEVSSGVRPIEGVSTSTAAFLGKAAMGPLDRAFMVTNFIEFTTNYGGFLTDSFLAHAALQFFNNGGNRLYVVRVAAGALVAVTSVADRKGSPARTITFSANSAGGWGNLLGVIVANGTLNPGNEFKLTVTVNGTATETFDNLSVNPDSTNFVDRVVGAGSHLIVSAADPTDDSTAAGTSVSAASAGTTLPSNKRTLDINVNGDGLQTITLADPCTTGAQIAAAIQAAVVALAPIKSTTPVAAYTSFTAGFATGVYTLTSGVVGKHSAVVVTNDPATSNAATLLKLGVANGGVESTGAAILRPALGTYGIGTATIGGNVVAPTTLGSDGTTPQDADYMTALSLLDIVHDVNIVAVPGIGSTNTVSAGVSYCDNRGDCFFIGDMGASDNTKEFAALFAGLLPKSSYGAVYFPWVKAVDPSGASATPIATPPSGYLAGIYARTDGRRGVWKAPAGTEALIGGAVGLTKVSSDAEQDTLNPIGVNVLRFFPSAGFVVWGARTLATQSNPEYRYIPIRRLAIFLEQSIYNGIQWAVFEPNAEDLWASLRLNIGAFMMNQFRAGAFQGTTPAQAFFVKCDASTNPQSQIDAGIVTVLVGFAPLKPAEFVVIQISQKTGDSAG